MKGTIALAVAFVAGCAGTPAFGPANREDTSSHFRSLREAGAGAPEDPTVRPARLVPAALDESHAWGVDPGGGLRAVVAGVRTLMPASGDVLAATSRLPANPSSVVELPERLGGGFLLAVGARLWRAKTWLGPLDPVATLSFPVSEVFVGLDRVYLRSPHGALFAMDPRTGQALDLGPLPASPLVASIAALDAWRAVAIADLRGTLLTVDAGASWRPIALAIEPSRVVTIDEGFAVGTPDRGRGGSPWWEVFPDGQAGPMVGAAPLGPLRGRQLPRRDPTARPLGARPLLAAVEDGWPMRDKTALIARDGFLVRVRLADGVVVESVPDAFPLKSARCHPLSLSGAADRAAFGFVCGEPSGTTVVYRWDERVSRLVELRRFASPREVIASNNGNLAVRGPCTQKTGDISLWTRDQPFCVMNGHGWNELHLRGEGSDRARIVALSDGRVAVVRPPEPGDLSTARLTLIDGVTDGARTTHLALRVPPMAADVARALRLGMWMDGFEERSPGVLSGWVEAAGSVLGVEIALDGELRAGEFIHDAGAPLVSGRWAFGWTASGSGFESTDGGMSWTKEIALPEPIAEPKVGRDRACGPIGCVMAGWLRIGWGSQEASTASEPPRVELANGGVERELANGGVERELANAGNAGTRSRAVRRAASLTLQCDPLDPPGPYADPPAQSVLPATGTHPSPRSPPASSHVPYGAGAAEFRPFAGRASPSIPDGDLGLSVEAANALDHGFHAASLGRVYAWGPGSGDWESMGRWQVRWQWPWGGKRDVRSSAAGPSPWSTADVATRAFASGAGAVPEWMLVPGDDVDHAVLMGRRLGPAANASVFSIELLETDRAPVEVKRANGEPLADIEALVRSAGRWYFATAQGPGEPTATVLWLADGPIARELGRLPRTTQDVLTSARLAARSDATGGGSVAVGLVVAGPDVEYGTRLWISSFDSEAHAFRDPEPLSPADLSDRPVTACTGDDAGWDVDMNYPAGIDVRVGSRFSVRMHGAVARMRLWQTGACIRSIFGSAGTYGPHAFDDLAGSPDQRSPVSSRSNVAAAAARTIGAGVVIDSTRVALSCRQESK